MATTRARWTLALAVLLLPLAPGPALGHATVPHRIALPDDWQPEGITTDGTSLFVGSLRNGAVRKIDPRTGKGRVVVKGHQGRTAVGVEYDAAHHLLWVAGGPTMNVWAYDARSGALRARYHFPLESRFINDLVVTGTGVFATDSNHQALCIVPFRRNGSVRGPGSQRTLSLTEDLVYQEGFNLNGIVKYRGRLLSVQTNTGQLFRINRLSGVAHLVDTGGYSLVNGDGLEIHGRRLFVVRNQDELVAVLQLNRRATRATLVRELTEPTEEAWDVPSTVALLHRRLWLVNARFNTPPTATTSYWISRVVR